MGRKKIIRALIQLRKSDWPGVSQVTLSEPVSHSPGQGRAVGSEGISLLPRTRQLLWDCAPGTSDMVGLSSPHR